MLSAGYSWDEAEKLIQELAWRDYWQLVWRSRGTAIHSDLKNPQQPVSNYQIPKAVIQACTGIEAVDSAISELYRSGYMHNHMRMYVASICCNIGHSHWLEPAKWMYAHLLDGDIASNQLSWQWVAGTFSKKKYYANQDNINNFFKSTQKGSFLDVDYESFEKLETPKVLTETTGLELDLQLPETQSTPILKNQETLIYNYYTLDPAWHEGENLQRVFLIEPSVFQKHLVQSKCMDFALELSKNITNIKLFVGEFSELLKHIDTEKIMYKEHPLNSHYTGKEEPREWLTSLRGDFPSFFSFWKQCKRALLK